MMAQQVKDTSKLDAAVHGGLVTFMQKFSDDSTSDGTYMERDSPEKFPWLARILETSKDARGAT